MWLGSFRIVSMANNRKPNSKWLGREVTFQSPVVMANGQLAWLWIRRSSLLQQPSGTRRRWLTTDWWNRYNKGWCSNNWSRDPTFCRVVLICSCAPACPHLLIQMGTADLREQRCCVRAVCPLKSIWCSKWMLIKKLAESCLFFKFNFIAASWFCVAGAEKHLLAIPNLIHFLAGF